MCSLNESQLITAIKPGTSFMANICSGYSDFEAEFTRAKKIFRIILKIIE
jgi:hypothetical protein